MSLRRFAAIGIAASVLLACPIGTLLAQTTWMHPPIEQGLALEFTKAKFNDEPELKFWTSTAFLYGRWKANRQLSLVFELPVANLDYHSSGNWYWDELPFTVRSSVVGNPYLGVELGEEGSSLIAELGLRPPLLGEANSEGDYMSMVVGSYVAYDRFEAFIPKLATFQAAFGYRGLYPSGTIKSTLRLLGGATAMVPDDGDAEVFIDGCADYWMHDRSFAVGFGLTGRYLLTESELDFNERTVFQIKSAAQIGLGQFHPGIHVQVPLDSDLTDVVSLMFGIDLVFDLSKPAPVEPTESGFHW